MSLSMSQKPDRTENPFLRVSSPPIPRRVSMGFGVDQTMTPIGVPAIRSLTCSPMAKRRPWLNLRTTLVVSLTGLLFFALLATGFQQRTLNAVELSPTVPQTVLRVPLPVDYTFVSSVYGPRRGRLHQGIDLAAKTGSPIYAASAGVITYSGWESGYGQSVVIDHGKGLKTRYAHCSKLLIRAGLPVQKGQIIARVGSTGHSTGPHLHFEVLVNGVRKNPAWYYPFKQAPHQYVLTTMMSTPKNWRLHFSDQVTRWVKS
jgi:hypothetical protein